MKIVCDSCATKYSISDDKVRGKVFKIRCKKCSHIIVVRGTNDASTTAAATPSALVADGGWHLVVDGEQVGPLSESDIRGRLARGEIDAETYIWKDGFADWLKLSAVSEFAGGLGAVGEGSSSSAGPDLFSEGPSMGIAESGAVRQPAGSGRSAPGSTGRSGAANVGGGLFAGIDAADAALQHGASDADVDAFSPPVTSLPRSGGGDLFSAHAAPSSADDGGWGSGGGGLSGHDGGRIESLTAQRHENSVLFSLANLQSLAMPSSGGASGRSATASSAPSSGSEGSGLIDIRAMAATTLGTSGEPRGFGDDLPAFGAFSPAAPMLLEMPNAGRPSKWIYPAIGLLVLLVGAISVMAYNIITTKPATIAEIPTKTVVAPEGTPPAGKPTAAVPAAAVPTPPSDEPLPPREVPTAEAKPGEAGPSGAAPGGSRGAAKPERAAAGARRAGGKPSRDRRGTVPERKVAAAPVAAAESPEKKPTKGSLDDLLESALSSKPRPAASRPRVDDDGARRGSSAPEAPSGGPMSKAAVVGGMNGVKPKISECYNQFKVPGMAMVNVVIGKNGRVSSATVTGKFAGTPTGSCVERAVKTASFPPSDGLTTPYPFTLR